MVDDRVQKEAKHKAEDKAAEDNADKEAKGATKSGLSSPSAKLGNASKFGTARLVSSVVAVLIIALLGLLAFAPTAEPETSDTIVVGATSPAVSGPIISGGSGEFDIAAYRGSWVVVNFFGTWCTGCVLEHPELVELETWGAERGDVQLVSVVFNDSQERVQEFFSDFGGSWPVITSAEAAVLFQVAQIPETFLVAPSGTVVLRTQGQVTAEDIQAVILEMTRAG